MTQKPDFETSEVTTTVHKDEYCLVIVERQSRVLMIRKNDKFNYPGGKIEPGESIIDACARELEEETGLQGILTPRGQIIGEDYHIYVATAHCWGEPQSLTDEPVSWQYVRKLHDLPLVSNNIIMMLVLNKLPINWVMHPNGKVGVGEWPDNVESISSSETLLST